MEKITRWYPDFDSYWDDATRGLMIVRIQDTRGHYYVNPEFAHLFPGASKKYPLKLKQTNKWIRK